MGIIHQPDGIPAERQVPNRVQLGRLAEERAAFRRVAALMAQGAAPAEVFEVVCAEAGRLISADAASLSRYETDGMLKRHGVGIELSLEEFRSQVDSLRELRRQ